MTTKTADKRPAADATRPPAAKPPADGGWRETVESVAMAIILALVFRSFVAEAFVIPTGSMAPTLQGRHKDVFCPECGYNYRAGASTERDEFNRPTGAVVDATTCPNCGYIQNLALAGADQDPNHASFSGDRIIVSKFAYDLAEPQRWDVIVFKCPGRATQNYIKRLVGLPNETIRIVGGNIYVKPRGAEQFHIARKPPHKLDALLQPVHNTEFPAQDLVAVGWPNRWRPAGASAWDVDREGKAYTTAGAGDEVAWLQYRHVLPTDADWEQIQQGRLPEDAADRRGQLIDDFYAYNGYFVGGQPPGSMYDVLPHWVDDLAVDAEVEIRGNAGHILLDLVRGGDHYRARINVATGEAELAIISAQGQALPFVGDDGQPVPAPTATTSVKGPGRHRLRLSNVDHELLLWVDGKVVKFSGPTSYASAERIKPHWTPDDPGDLAPAAIGSQGADITVRKLQVLRDKYYIATSSTGDPGSDGNDYTERFDGGAGVIDQLFASPEYWAETSLFDARRSVEFVMGEDQFFPLGDNSPQSQDARLWARNRWPGEVVVPHYVHRDLLVGKAMLIYWPHTWNAPLPFWPNFRQMGFIR